jgi:hypothetical protein
MKSVISSFADTEVPATPKVPTHRNKLYVSILVRKLQKWEHKEDLYEAEEDQIAI